MSCFLSLSLSLSGYFFGAQRPSEFTFLPRLLRPSREGTLRLHPIEKVPEASVNRASPVPGALLAFCVNQGISASFSLLYFLIGRLQTTRFWSIKDLNSQRITAVSWSPWPSVWKLQLHCHSDSQICLLSLLSSQSFLSDQQGMLLELQILCEGKHPQPLEEIKKSNKAKNAT